jgi:D-sedoheptulose 7-phosphate isomerase
MKVNKFLKELAGRYPQLSSVSDQIQKAADSLVNCQRNGRKVLICGNGGSSADSDHLAGELMKSFEKDRTADVKLKEKLEAAGERGKYLSGRLRQGVPAISLTSNNALMTAIANDNDASLVFAQQVAVLGTAGDVLICISTSGNAQNVIDAAITAKARGIQVIGLTGETGGRLKQWCDILISVPGTRTAFIQELHLPVYHTICRILEATCF